MNPGAMICSLPTWDYALAGYLVSSLPGEVRNVLTRTEALTLQMLVYLCGLQARKSGRQSLYATPSQSYLGEHASRSDRSIRRGLSTLTRLGLLGAQRRRPLRGHPQTNLYQLGGQLLALLKNIKWPKTLAKSHADKNGRQRPKEKVRRSAPCAPTVLEGYHISHKPADLASLPHEAEANRLSREDAKRGFELIYQKLRGAAA